MGSPSLRGWAGGGGGVMLWGRGGGVCCGVGVGDLNGQEEVIKQDDQSVIQNHQEK